jgi:hypothetical protein
MPRIPEAIDQPDVEEVAMLEGTRIPPVDAETLPDDLRLNRRVASWNGCEF